MTSTYTSICPDGGPYSTLSFGDSYRHGVAACFNSTTVLSGESISSFQITLKSLTGSSETFDAECRIYEWNGTAVTTTGNTLIGTLESKSVTVNTAYTTLTFSGSAITTTSNFMIGLWISEDVSLEIRTNYTGTCSSDTGQMLMKWNPNPSPPEFEYLDDETLPTVILYGGPAPSPSATRLPPPPLIARF